MADTGAERQRRSRAHKRGDHSLCDPSRCSNAPRDASNGVTNPAPPATERPPHGLAARGRRLWTETLAAEPTRPLKPAERLLLEEACRLADRLDRLDRVLQHHDDWFTLHALDDDGRVVRVILNNALSEARQQQLALKALLAEFRQSRTAAVVKGTTGRGGTPSPTTGQPAPRAAGGIVSLTARLAERKNR